MRSTSFPSLPRLTFSQPPHNPYPAISRALHSLPTLIPPSCERCMYSQPSHLYVPRRNRPSRGRSYFQVYLTCYGVSFSLHVLCSDMHPPPGTRHALPSTSFGMGHHFSSPQKRRQKKKTQTNVVIPGQLAKRQRLLQHLNELLNDESPLPLPSATSPPSPEDIDVDISVDIPTIQPPTDEPSFKHIPDSLVPNVTVGRLYDTWTMVIPTIVESYLQYMTETVGKPITSHDTPLFDCHGCCEPKRSSLLCLYFDCASINPIPVQMLMSFQVLLLSQF